MRMPCDLIQDLLPLYHDEVCSQTSREAVEEHLQDCSTCQKVLDAMGGELLTPEEKEEEKELRSLAEWWKKQKKKNHLNAIVYTMFLVVILGVGYYFATWYVYLPISADKIEISHVCQLSDGRISFNSNMEGGCSSWWCEQDEDGTMYIIPKRRFPGTAVFNDPLWWNDRMNFYPAGYEKDSTSPLAGFEPDLPITAVYVGPVGKGILVWQEGDVVPQASEEWEALVTGTDYEQYYKAVSKD
ncbi:MAG: zf-HC2 domain-containing protein [Ruminiclostridium sp.]|nr:zf-HC2 domain-containing protein [Ruminiclostridium sp.]